MELHFDYTEDDYVAGIGGLYRVLVKPDNEPESPREWTPLCIMDCDNHRRYTLGDKGGEDSAVKAIYASRYYRDTWEDGDSQGEGESFQVRGARHDVLDLRQPADRWRAIQLCDDIVALPLFLCDHSGISISTGPFSCPCDSGQIGFAFVTLQSAGWNRWSPKRREQARQWIESETRTYDSYLRGDVYGYVTERAKAWDECGDPAEWEEVDSCWGYYGDPNHYGNPEDSGLAEAAIAGIKWDMKGRRDALPDELRDARSRLSKLNESAAEGYVVEMLGEAKSELRKTIERLERESGLLAAMESSV